MKKSKSKRYAEIVPDVKDCELPDWPKRISIPFRTSQENRDAIKKAAAKEGVSMNEWISKRVERDLDI